MVKKGNHLVGGIILIAIGLLALVGQLVDLSSLENLGVFFLAALGAIFLLWGILAHDVGPMIPGGILSGLGWGTALIAGPFSVADNLNEGGVFLLTFALGWVLITLLSAVFTDKTHWWPLIPGAIIGLVGLSVLYGGVFLESLEFMGNIWPVLLIVLGIYILFHSRRIRQNSEGF
jgi:hypothetical protein